MNSYRVALFFFVGSLLSCVVLSYLDYDNVSTPMKVGASLSFGLNYLSMVRNAFIINCA